MWIGRTFENFGKENAQKKYLAWKWLQQKERKIAMNILINLYCPAVIQGITESR